MLAGSVIALVVKLGGDSGMPVRSHVEDRGAFWRLETWRHFPLHRADADHRVVGHDFGSHHREGDCGGSGEPPRARSEYFRPGENSVERVSPGALSGERASSL